MVKPSTAQHQVSSSASTPVIRKSKNKSKSTVIQSPVPVQREDGVLGIWQSCRKDENALISPFQLINYAKSRGISSAARSHNLKTSLDRGFITGMSTIMVTVLPLSFDLNSAIKAMDPFQRKHYDPSKPAYGVISGSHRLKEALRRMELVFIFCFYNFSNFLTYYKLFRANQGGQLPSNFQPILHWMLL